MKDLKLKYNNIVFLCGARDFHAMDWYTSAKILIEDSCSLTIVTDLIQGESFNKLVDSSDNVYKLLILGNI